MQWPRRRVLALGGGAIGTAIAGCLGRPAPSGPPPTPHDEFLRELSFEGPDLIVQLKDGHTFSRLNLIAPDGSLFGQTTVPVGATTARIELLDIKPERAGLKHYTPGEHELVAISESESQSVPVDLAPELRIVDVWQYRDGSKASDYGKLVVEVENVGTGPTWVYSITYQNSPNFAADGELGGDPGVLSLEFPTHPSQAVVAPNQTQTFIGSQTPLQFPDENQKSCDGTVELTLFVESPLLDPLPTTVRTAVDGELQSVGLVGEYTCAIVQVERIGSE